MRYRDKLAELAKWTRARIIKVLNQEQFEVRVDDTDDDCLRVKLYMRNARGNMEDAGCMVDVSPRPHQGVVLLRVNMSCTFCHTYSEEALVRLAGFAAIDRIGRTFYARTKGAEYTV